MTAGRLRSGLTAGLVIAWAAVLASFAVVPRAGSEAGGVLIAGLALVTALAALGDADTTRA